MTMPRVEATDWYAQYGPGSPAWLGQLNAFNAARDQWQQRVSGQDGITGSQLQQAPAAAPAWKDEDLVGAAVYWGMPEQYARALPRDELIRIVNMERANARQGEQSTARTIGEMARAMPAMFAVGAGEAITGGLQRLPIFGEMFARSKTVHDADQWLRRIEESIRSSTPESFQWVNTTTNVAGNLAAMYYPASGAWALAGKLGGGLIGGEAVGLSARAIARGAYQGGASAWLLTGGSEEFKNNPKLSLALGAGLGAVMPVAEQAWTNWAAPRLAALSTRVTKAFVSPEIMRPVDYRPEIFKRPIERSGVGEGPGPVLGVQREPGMVGPEFGFRQEPAPGPTQGQNIYGQPQGLPPEQTAPVAPGATIQETMPLESPLTNPRQLSIPFGETPPPLTPAPKAPLDVLSELAAQGDEQARVMLNFLKAQQPEVAAAANLAGQMNKAATIIQSPAFGEIAGQTQIDDLAVVKAMEATNPGGTGVVQGINDPVSFAQSVPGARFVKRPGTDRLDALVGVSEEQAAQYEAHGVYTGQHVLGPDGVQSVVEDVVGGTAKLRPLYGEVPSATPVSELHPQVTSPVEDIPTPEKIDILVKQAPWRPMGRALNSLQASEAEFKNLWPQFAEYAQGRAAATATEMGVDAASVHAQNLSQYLDDFLSDGQVTNPMVRDWFKRRVDQMYVQAYRNVRPDITIPAQIEQAAARETPSAATKTGRIDEAAQAKGMRATPLPGDAWEIETVPINGEDPSVLRFPTTESAEEWLLKTVRELPDVTPPSDVPIEVAGQLPVLVTQPGNPSAAEADAIVGAIADVAGDTIDGLPNLMAEAQAARASGALGRLRQIYEAGISHWQPARRLWSSVERTLAENGMPTLRPGADYDELTRLVTILHNEQHPWMNKAKDISTRIRPRWRHDGTWSRVYEIEDDAARLAAAQAQGFKPAEIEAMQMMDQFWADLFPETGLDAARQIRRYLPHIARRQSDPTLALQAWDAFPLSNVTQPWYEHMRAGNFALNVRELNPEKLMDSYIRALTWKKVMAEPYAMKAEFWKTVAQEIPELSGVAHHFGAWMNIIRHGYDASDDLAMSALHGVLKTLMGPEVTRAQAKSIASLGMNATHSSFLGFRVHVMARDALQLLLAVPRAGSDLIGVMARVSKDPEYARDIFQRALAEGAVALHSPRMTGATALGEFQQAAALGEGATVQQSRRYRMASQLSEKFQEMLPRWLRDVRDTPFHPMYFYGKQAEFMRALTWESGRIKADRALQAFRAAGPNGSLEKLMADSGARTFDPAWQTEFKRLVAAGDDAKAAGFLGRQLADATNFKYGVIEQPIVSRGLTGRVAMQFGQYPLQLLQYMRESLRNGGVSDKVAFLGTLGLVSGALYKASRATGWNFNPMNPFAGMMFTGGPIMQGASDILQGANTMIRAAQGQENAMSEFQAAQGANAAGRFVGMFNPLRGLTQTYGALNTALESPAPGEAVARYLITGQQGNQLDINNQLLPQATEMFQNSLHTMPSPVRAGAYGTPNVPQQPMTQPPGVNPPTDSMRGNIPPPEVLQQLGVTDPSRVRMQNGALVYDSNIVGADGRVATHFLSEAGRLLRPGQTWEQREMELRGANPLSLHNSLPDTSTSSLEPETRGRVEAMLAMARAEGVNIPIGETRRPQDRQDYIFAQGRNAALGGRIATWTMTSNHYDGRALDFNVTPGSPEDRWLEERAPIFGLKKGLGPNGPSDPGHVSATDSSIAATPRYPGMQAPSPSGPPGGGAMF